MKKLKPIITFLILFTFFSAVLMLTLRMMTPEPKDTSHYHISNPQIFYKL